MSDTPDDIRGPARRKWLFGAAIATLAACAWVAWQPDESTEPARRPTTGRAASGTTAARPAALPSPEPAVWPEPPSSTAHGTWPEPTAEGLVAWEPPAPPAPPAAPAPLKAAAPNEPAPVPPAPPFPYTLIGQIDDGVRMALLAGPRRSIGVKANDLIDTQWRVDQVDAEGLTLTWLPSGEKKTIAFTTP